MATDKNGVIIPDEILPPSKWAIMVVELNIDPTIVIDNTNLIRLNGNPRVYIGRDESL